MKKLKYYFIYTTICLLRVGFADPPSSFLWEKTFEENFDGNKLDYTRWKDEHGYLAIAGWRDNKRSVRVSNGMLSIYCVRTNVALKTPTAIYGIGIRTNVIYSTGSIAAKNFVQTYGYWEARIRYAATNNFDNAWWMWNNGSKTATNNPHQEIDINEGRVDLSHKIYGMNVHYCYNSGNGTNIYKKYPKDVNITTHPEKNFHVYGLEWNSNKIIWYLDGVKVHEMNNPGIHINLRPILGLAVITWGGRNNYVTNWNLAALDGKHMDVDWVRIYKKSDFQYSVMEDFGNLSRWQQTEGTWTTVGNNVYNGTTPSILTWNGLTNLFRDFSLSVDFILTETPQPYSGLGLYLRSADTSLNYTTIYPYAGDNKTLRVEYKKGGVIKFSNYSGGLTTGETIALGATNNLHLSVLSNRLYVALNGNYKNYFTLTGSETESGKISLASFYGAKGFFRNFNLLSENPGPTLPDNKKAKLRILTASAVSNIEIEWESARHPFGNEVLYYRLYRTTFCPSAKEELNGLTPLAFVPRERTLYRDTLSSGQFWYTVITEDYTKKSVMYTPSKINFFLPNDASRWHLVEEFITDGNWNVENAGVYFGDKRVTFTQSGAKIALSPNGYDALENFRIDFTLQLTNQTNSSSWYKSIACTLREQGENRIELMPYLWNYNSLKIEGYSNGQVSFSKTGGNAVPFGKQILPGTTVRLGLSLMGEELKIFSDEALLTRIQLPAHLTHGGAIRFFSKGGAGHLTSLRILTNCGPQLPHNRNLTAIPANADNLELQFEPATHLLGEEYLTYELRTSEKNISDVSDWRDEKLIASFQSPGSMKIPYSNCLETLCLLVKDSVEYNTATYIPLRISDVEWNGPGKGQFSILSPSEDRVFSKKADGVYLTLSINDEISYGINGNNISIYSANGALVAKPMLASVNGKNEFLYYWNLKNGIGHPVSAGVYWLAFGDKKAFFVLLP